jgi:uncharacterized OsmC-like protein
MIWSLFTCSAEDVMTDLEVHRTGPHEFLGTNSRGATVRIGRNGAEGAFTPGELLQIAVAGCASVTVEELVTRRAGDDARMEATVDYERGPGAREYERLRVVLAADLSFLDDTTRERVVRAMKTAVERECTVSRTVERGAPVDLTLDTGRR